MRRETETILAGAFLIILFGIVSSYAVKHRAPATLTQEVRGSWACTTEVKECPDGTLVSRIPPYCLFASCPVE